VRHRVAIAVLLAGSWWSPRLRNQVDLVLQSWTPKHGLGRGHVKTAVDYRCM